MKKFCALVLMVLFSTGEVQAGPPIQLRVHDIVVAIDPEAQSIVIALDAKRGSKHFA